MAKDCNKPRKNNGDSGGGCGGNKFKGRFGHMAKDCFEDENNASKFPSGWKSKKEHPNVNVNVNVNGGGGGTVELLLAGMTFPDDPKILMSNDVWVADSGIMTHITPHADGMVDMIAPNAFDIVAMGNGTHHE
jgi:hypothetical protein